MNERALILLLETWHERLEGGLAVARAALPDPEPERVRAWNVNAGVRFSIPTESSNPDLWDWVERPRTPPMLLDLEGTIASIGEQIARLRGAGDD